MTKEALKIRQQVADLINENPYNISNYDWIAITNGFEVEEMTALLCHIAYDDIFENVADCIIKAWDEALSHKDPKCFYDYTDGIPRAKYRGSHTLKYEIDNIRKRRQLCIDNAKRQQENQQNNATKEKSQEQNDRIAELESELEKAKEQVADLEKQNKDLKDSIELLSTDIPEIDAQQKVRMELARKIMSEAGMNAAFMVSPRGRKTKVATLMGTMLDIPTHTCASWLSRQELNRETHHESIKEINDIFEFLGLPFRI